MSDDLLAAYDQAMARLSNAIVRVENRWNGGGMALLQAFAEFYAAKRGLSDARRALEASGVMHSERSESLHNRALHAPKREREARPRAVILGRVIAHLRANGERSGRWNEKKRNGNVS